MDSILTTIKKMLGIDKEYAHFDVDIITNINMALMVLKQLGVCSESAPSITGDLDSWEDIFRERTDIDGVKTYIYLKVKIAFDPPTSSFVLDAMNKQITELEWRLNVQADAKETGGM